MIVNNKDKDNSQPIVTDWLAFMYAEKRRLREELKISKQNLHNEMQDLFAPLPKAHTRWESMMVTFNRGLSIYEGIMTGMTVVRGIRHIFGKRK